MAYQLILTVGAVVLAIVHLLDAHASIASRLIVLVIVLASFALPRSVSGQTIAILMQLSAALYVLLRRQARKGT